MKQQPTLKARPVIFLCYYHRKDFKDYTNHFSERLTVLAGCACLHADDSFVLLTNNEG